MSCIIGSPWGHLPACHVLLLNLSGRLLRVVEDILRRGFNVALSVGDQQFGFAPG